MGFSGKMENALSALEGASDEVPVANVTADKFITRVTFNIAQIVQVSGIGQFVEIDYPYVRVAVQKEMDKVASNESRTPCNEQSFAVESVLRAYAIRFFHGLVP